MRKFWQRYSKPILLLMFIGVLFGIVYPVAAHYIGPSGRTYTTSETVDVGVWARKPKYYCECKNGAGQCTDCTICEWTRSPGSPCGDATYSYKTGTTTIDTDHTYPNATASGTFACGTAGSNGWCKGGPAINFTANEPVSGKYIQLIEGNFGTYCDPADAATISCSWTPPQGLNTVTYWAHTTYGDTSVQGSIANVKVDTVAPAVSIGIGSPNGANGWYVSNVTATASGTDATSGVAALNVNIDGGTWQANGTVYSNQGTHTVRALTTDNAGLTTTSAAATFSLDSVAPTVSISVPTATGSNGWFKTSPVVVTGTSSDATSGVASTQYQIDGGAWTTGTSASVSGNGTHTVNFRATDIAGNVGATTSATVKIDTTVPTLGFAGVTNGGTITSAATITPASSDAPSGVAAQSVSLDNATWAASVTTTGGWPKTVYCSATDNAGNVTSAACGTYYYDVVAPSPVGAISNSCSYTSGQWNSTCTSPSFSWAAPADSGSGIKGYNVYYGTSSTGTPATFITATTYAPAAISASGQYYFRIQSVDVAGNVSSTITSFINAYDASIPTSSLNITSGVKGNNNWYVTTPVNFTITGADTHSGLKSILYKIDPVGGTAGSWVTLNGSTYSGSVTQSSVINYYVLDNLSNSSSLKTQTVNVDKTAPTASFTSNPVPNVDGWNNSFPTISFTGSDGTGGGSSGVAIVKYSVDGGAWVTVTPPTGSYTINKDENTLVEVYVEDMAGNFQTLSYEALVDLQGPSAGLSLGTPDGPNGWFKTPVTATVTGDDLLSGLKSLQVTLDNGAWQPNNTVFSVEGTHTVTGRAVDLAGNTYTTPASTYKLDTVAPSVMPVVPAVDGTNGYYTTAPVAITATVTDATSGVAQTQYQIDAGAWVTGTSASVSSNGTHTVNFRSTDNAGNVSAVVSTTIKIDTTTPTLNFAGVTKGSTITAAATITPASTDATSGIASQFVSLDNATWTASVITTQGWPVTVYCKATDNAGNTNSGACGTYFFDVTNPTISFAPGQTAVGGWYKSPLAVAINRADTYSGIASTTYTVNGGASQTLSGASVSLAASGAITSYNLAATTTDNAGKTASTSATYQIDANAPTLSVSMPLPNGANGWSTSAITVNLNADDTASGVKRIGYAVLPRGSAAAPTYTYVSGSTVSVTISSPSTIHWVAEDNVGNATADRADDVLVDTGAPSVTGTPQGTPNAGGWYSSAVTVNVAINDTPAAPNSGIATKQYRINAGAWTTISGTSFVVPTSGISTVDVRAVDMAGNTTTSTLTIKIDGAAPTISATLPTPDFGNWVRAANAMVTLNASDAETSVASIFYLVIPDGVTPAPTVYTQVNAANASVTLTRSAIVKSYAVDAAGNTSATRSDHVYLDNIAPVITLTPPAVVGGWYDNPTALAVSVTDGPTPGGSGLAKVEYRLNGAASWSTLTTTAGAGTINLTTEGTNTIEVRATDAANNTAAAVSLTMKLDGTAPVLSENAPAADGTNGWHITGPISVELNAADPSVGVDKLYYRINGGSYTAISGATTTLSLNDGTHIVDFYAVDKLGNSAAVKTLTYTIDTKAPVITLTPGSKPVSGWYLNPLDLTVTITDGAAGSGVNNAAYKLDLGLMFGTPLALTNDQAVIKLTREDLNTVMVEAFDKAGNMATVQENYSLDGSPALLQTYATPEAPDGQNGWYKTAPITVMLFVDDHEGVGFKSMFYRVNGGDYIEYTDPHKELTLSSGIHVVEFYGVDLLGNTTPVDQKTYKVDNQSPEVSTAIAPTTMVGEWYQQVERLTVTATDLPVLNPQPALKMEYAHNGSGWQLVSGPILVGQGGTNTINLRVTDEAGNITTKQVILKVDVAKPTISVDFPATDGDFEWYVTPPTIKATYTDLDSGIADYSYSLDGGDPVKGDTVTITTSGQHSLKFSATDHAGHTYDYINNFIYVDLSEPVITVVSPEPDAAPSWYYAGPVTINATASDPESPVQLFYQIDDGDEKSVSGAITVSGEGKHLVTVRATNKAGLDQIQQIPVWIDSVPPSVEIVVPPGQNENGWYDGPVTLPGIDDLTGDIAKVEYRLLPDGSFTETPPAFTESGVYQVEVKLTDEAGHVTIEIITIRVDLDGPELSLTTPDPDGKNGWYQSDPVTVKGQASDSVAGVDSLCYALDGKAQVCDGSTPSVSGEGEHTLIWTVMDTAGNTTTETVEIKIDHTTPDLYLTTPAPDGLDGWYVTSPVELNASADDSVSGMAHLCYVLDGGQPVCDGTPVTVEGDGQHSVTWTAEDTAGNIAQQVIEINIDTAHPTIKVVAPTPDGEDGWYVKGPVTFTNVTTSDDGSGVANVCYSIDGDPAICDGSQASVNGSGTHNIVWTVTDTAGNVTTHAEEVRLDTNGPVISPILPEPDGQGGWFVHSQLTLDAKVTDSVSGVAAFCFKVDNGAPVCDGSKVTVSGDGEHTVVWTAKDSAGNTSTSTEAIKIDSTKPKIQLVNPTADGKNGWFISSPLVYSAKASDGDSGVKTLCYTLDSGAPVCGSESLEISGEGKHELVWTATDTAGNQEIVTVPVNIALTAPALTVIAPSAQTESGWYTQKPVIVTAEASDKLSPAKIEYQINGGAWMPYGEGVSVATENQNHMVIRATNEAGLSVVRELDVNIDTIAPVIDDILPPGIPTDGSGYVGGVELPGEGEYPEGVSEIKYRILPDGEWSLIPPAFDQTELYEFEVSITDQTGTVYFFILNFNVDRTAPEIVTDLTGEDNPVSNLVTVNGTAVDRHSGLKQVEVTLDGTNWTTVALNPDGTFSYDFDSKAYGNGQHVTLQVRAVDQVGNHAETQIGMNVNNQIRLFLPVVVR